MRRSTSIFIGMLVLCAALLLFYFSRNNLTLQLHSSSVPKESFIAYHPPIVSCPFLVVFVDRRYDSHTRLDTKNLSQIPTKLEEGDIFALKRVLADPNDADNVRNEAANILTRVDLRNLPQMLLAVLDAPNEKARFRAFVTQHLSGLLVHPGLTGQQESVLQGLQLALKDRDIEVRREAVLGLVQVDDVAAVKLLTLALTDTQSESDGLRHIAIRYAGEKNLRQYLPQIREFARNQDETVRVVALNTLTMWNGQDSIELFSEASQSASPRVQNAGRIALAKRDSLQQIFSREDQSIANLSEALRHERIQIRNEAALALLRFGKDAAPALPALLHAIQRLEPSCTNAHVAAYLDNIRVLGTQAKSASGVLLPLMEERAAVYQNRKKPDVMKLRAYILLTLHDIGESPKTTQFIAEALANSDKEMTFTYAVAARCAGTFGSEGKPFVPLLLRALDPNFVDSKVTLQSFHAPITPDNQTSCRIEAIRALKAIGPASVTAVPLLLDLSRTEPSPSQKVPAWKEEAKKALAAIDGNSGF